jgi:DNA end-binding protein Ku
MRAIWKGHIRFSLVTIPIRIYGAIESSQAIRFNQLHKDCNGLVGYQKKCKKCGEDVDKEEILKGYQYEPEQFVIVEQQDFDKLKLKSTKAIDIEGFVDAREVHTTLYDTPYFVGPDGEVASKPYSLLCNTLKKTGKMGIGRVVMRDREDVVLIAPEKNGIMFYKLRYPDEIRDITKIPDLADAEPSPEELKLAETLVASMNKKLSDIELKDRYGDALREVIDAKIEGKEIVVLEEEEKEVVDIMTALKASIEQAKAEKKPMKKATGKKKTVKAEEKVA